MKQKNFKPLLEHPRAFKIISVFQKAGHEIRFVGGAVRDCLNGRKIGDIDFATPLEPIKAAALLESEGIRTIPTGIDYGTITAVVDGENFEITTLRKDVATDGRRAVVSFSRNWEEDAHRRDFTFNAMSLTPDGELYDPFNGALDLFHGRVIFIGNPEQRIKEDALRIMRFFRFHALFGKGKPDKAGLDACLEWRGLLDNLSAERVRTEVLKLLVSDNAAETWEVMTDNAILANVLPDAVNIEVLEKLIPIEISVDEISPIRRLISLYRPEKLVVSEVAGHAALTKNDTARFELYKSGKIPPDLAFGNDRDMLPYLYRFGRQGVKDALLIGLARAGAGTVRPIPEQLPEKLELVRSWERPAFPLSGNDVMQAFNMKEGKELGNIMRACEKMWIENVFEPTRDDLMSWAREHFFSE